MAEVRSAVSVATFVAKRACGLFSERANVEELWIELAARCNDIGEWVPDDIHTVNGAARIGAVYVRTIQHSERQTGRPYVDQVDVPSSYQNTLQTSKGPAIWKLIVASDDTRLRMSRSPLP